MQLTIVVGALAAVTLAVPPLAARAQTPPAYEVFMPSAGGARPLAHYLPAGNGSDRAVVAVRRRLLAQAAAAGVPASLIQAAQVVQAPPGARLQLAGDSSGAVATGGSASPSTSSLLPAGDLDGDHYRDLLDVRYLRSSNGRLSVMTAARAGATGRVLWSRVDRMAPGHFLFPQPSTVGAAGHTGVVLLDVGFEKTDSNTITVSDRLTALDGGAGRRLWQHSDKGTETFSNAFTGTHEPSINGFLQAAAGAKDVLLTVSDYSDDGTTRHGSVAVYRIRGANGSATRDGATVTSSDAIPFVIGFPDLSGDRREDYLVLTAGSTPRVEARRGDTGVPIWANTALALQPGAFAIPAGRITGAPVQDVVVSTGTPQSQLPGIATPAGDVPDPTTPAHGNVALLHGDTGAQVWTQTGDGAFTLGRAGPNLVPAVGVTVSDTTTDSTGTTETLHLQAYDVPGTRLYDQTYTVSAAPDRSGGTFGFGVGAAFSVGDLQRDGALDGLALLLAVDGSNVKERSVLYDGATGTAVKNNPQPAGDTLTGNEDDLLDVKGGSSILVTARSGRDQHALFSRRLRPGATMTDAGGYATTVQGRCADVIVLAANKTRAYAAVLTARGAVRWSIAHGSQDARALPATAAQAQSTPVCA